MKRNLLMAKLFTIDVSAIPAHEERYKIMEMFYTSFEVYEHWIAPDAFHRTFNDFDVFWPFESEPTFPQLPNSVKIIEK